MIVNQIIANPFESETAASWLKQGGTYEVIWSLYSDLSTLVAVTGLTRTAVAETVDPLIRRGFLTEEWEIAQRVAAERDVLNLPRRSSRALSESWALCLLDFRNRAVTCRSDPRTAL